MSEKEPIKVELSKVIVIIILLVLVFGGIIVISNLTKSSETENATNNTAITSQNISQDKDISVKPSTSYKPTTNNKKEEKTKVYTAVALSGAKVHSVDSKSGYVSFSRFCQYCGNEWGKSSFTIQRTEEMQISSGYCIKCKKHVGNVKIQCTVIEQ